MAGCVLVIEDEPGIVDFLERGLRAQGFAVSSAADGEEGLAVALETAPDVVLLDMLLPGRHGLDVLRELHAARPELPVIVLTAVDEIDDRVTGLDAGAVDYLTKPFSLAELSARIRAALRVASRSPRTSLSGGGIEVDLLTREVRRDGAIVRLSSTEFELLVHLMSNPGQVLGRDGILRAVWGYQHDPGTNVVDVYIGYLRRKLAGPTGGETSAERTRGPIVTVRSVGYRFDPHA